MFRIEGPAGKDLCDKELGVSRRDILRIGGSGVLGLSLGSMLQLQAASANSEALGGAGWGKAKSVIMVYLQGGPSHLDLCIILLERVAPTRNQSLRFAFGPIARPQSWTSGSSFLIIPLPLAGVPALFRKLHTNSGTRFGVSETLAEFTATA